MPRPEQTTSFPQAKLIGLTDKARRIQTDGGRYWIPRSVIVNDDELPDIGEAEVRVQTWFVEKEEID